MNLGVEPARDVHSFSEPSRARVTHCDLDLEVLFETRQLRGTALLTLDRRDLSAPLILDTRDLAIEEVRHSDPLPVTLSDRDPILGQALIVHLPAGVDSVLIRYSTSPDATGLQWLNPDQTAGKTSPFVYSQSQSIHARSWIPIQDSPGVRLTYNARITAPAGLNAVMSAHQESSENGVRRFRMEQPIPAYLIAFAVGAFEFTALGPRTGIYAEAPILSSAIKEFSDLEQLVATVEELYGPYQWGRYDLLVMPPSFPFGGMENPVVTFVTPTVIAGDKSLVSLISHELAHSWSGNLVTNATWRDFWLNEGFTTYIENRIQEEVYGREQALMEQALDQRELQRELSEFDSGDQILHINLTGRDPDEGCTRVPYVKGALLLRQMEHAFGRPVFDTFLRGYFGHFAFRSISTAEALEYISQELFARHPEQSSTIDLDGWVFAPGLPRSTRCVTSEALEAVAEGTEKAAQWNTQQWLEYLQTLPRPVPARKMSQLDAAFHLTQSGNYEILSEWLLLAIESRYVAVTERLRHFLHTVGRMKYLRPLYSELIKTREGRAMAEDIYLKARAQYHPIAQSAIDRILLFEQKVSGEQRIDP